MILWQTSARRLAGLCAAGALTAAAQAQPASGPARSAAQVMDPRAASQADMPQREALLKAAEMALDRGNTAMAILAFERAAMMLHSADTEMGLVRAWMQTGDYRRALAFCAHTAGAHRDSPAGSALYAWLLRMGGQGAYAQRLLEETLARAPGDPIVAEVHRAFQATAPLTTELLMALPHHIAPRTAMVDDQLPPPAGVAVLASGALLGDGRLALVPADPIKNAKQIWVRNGLGQTTQARVESTPDALLALGFTLLRLATPLDGGDTLLAPRDPFAGSPGYAVSYAAVPESSRGSPQAGMPAWPWLQQGFFGAFEGKAGMRKLGISLPAGMNGGPAFDGVGRLTGLALSTNVDGQAVMLPVSMFRELIPPSPSNTINNTSAESAPAAMSRMQPDEAYERALKVALQVIALP